MNKRQENRLTMYEGLLTLLQTNDAKVKSVGGFSQAVTELTAMVNELKTKSTEVNGATAGKTQTKYNAEDALVSLLLPICSAVYLHGRKQNNAEIKEKAHMTESRLRSMRDTELAAFGGVIADLATANAEGVAAFGITAEKVTELIAKAQAYSTAIGVRESSVAERKGARGSMSDLFDKADELLSEEIDRFMEMLRANETEFYNMYFSVRVVKDTGARHRTNGDPVPAPATLNK
ncbi:MAG: hypothetical protein PHP42_10780 [Bacteroidota bacterium]|nr:hypothetical protein [Bacteroidota bacterium]